MNTISASPHWKAKQNTCTTREAALTVSIAGVLSLLTNAAA